MTSLLLRRVLGRVREATPIFRNEQTGQRMLTRFGDVYETLRDRRLGRVYHHMYNHAELGQPAPDPRWGAFHRHERWSLLSLEPPDHTRIRKLVSKVFTSRSVTVLGPMIAALSGELIDRCRELGTFDCSSGAGAMARVPSGAGRRAYACPRAGK